MTVDPVAEDSGTENRSAHLRVQQYYGELLAGFRRRQADIAAEQDAKLAAWSAGEPTGRSERTPTATVDPTGFDEDDFSNNTWLR